MKDENEEIKNVIGCLVAPFAIPIVLVMFVLAIASEAYVLMWMWQWFVIPNFMVYSLTFGEAVGICLIISLLSPSTYQLYRPKIHDFMWSTLICNLYVRPWFILGIGWLVKEWLLTGPPI